MKLGFILKASGTLGGRTDAGGLSGGASRQHRNCAVCPALRAGSLDPGPGLEDFPLQGWICVNQWETGATSHCISCVGEKILEGFRFGEVLNCQISAVHPGKWKTLSSRCCEQFWDRFLADGGAQDSLVRVVGAPLCLLEPSTFWEVGPSILARTS